MYVASPAAFGLDQEKWKLKKDGNWKIFTFNIKVPQPTPLPRHHTKPETTTIPHDIYVYVARYVERTELSSECGCPSPVHHSGRRTGSQFQSNQPQPGPRLQRSILHFEIVLKMDLIESVSPDRKTFCPDGIFEFFQYLVDSPY